MHAELKCRHDVHLRDVKPGRRRRPSRRLRTRNPRRPEAGTVRHSGAIEACTMTLSDELGRLGELHQRGVLTDDEFVRAKARLLQAAPDAGLPPALDAVNRLRRSAADRWIAGVCGGLAAATGLAIWAWRLIFAALLLCGGAGVPIYLLLWVFVPSE
jgi:phage shock protein PspC (stress-responsive transcriptional regulator)